MTYRSKSVLPPDLASLIHHVELSRAGWREEAFRLLLLSIVGRHNGAMTIDDICNEVNRSIPAPVSSSQVEHVVNILVSQSQLVTLANERYRLSEGARADYMRRMDDDLSLTASVERAFDDAFGVLVEDAVVDWNRFLGEFLMPLVSDLGARTYELVTGNQSRIQDAPAYRRFLAGLDETYRETASDSLAAFFDSDDTNTRLYILRLLNNSFLAQAMALSDKAMKALLARTSKPLRIRVFLDTNFLFSLLGLHDHPADDVVLALHDVVSRMPGRVNVKFYVLPFTVDEVRKTLEGHIDRLDNFILDRRMARAIEEAKVSGILKRYAQNAYSSGGRMSARDYLSPYLHDFNQVIRDRGVELYNRDLDFLSTDDDVIGDVEEQMKIQEKTRPKERQKSYEKMLHDMKLWHFVRRERPSRVDSPLDAGDWAATLDFGLIGFDKTKRRSHEPGVCIHPTSLLHLLQLWVPSTDLLTSALMESLRPMLPRILDYDAEKISVRIVGVLSRFESGDLSDDTVSRVLLSQAVRERIRSATNQEQDIEIIQSEVAKANKSLAKQVEEHREQADAERRKANELESALQEERQKRRAVESRVRELGERVDEAERRDKEASRHMARRRALRKAVAMASVLGIGTMGVLGWCAIRLFRSRGDATWWEGISIWVVVMVMGTGVGSEVLRRSVGRIALPSDGRLVRLVNLASSHARYVRWTVATVALGVLVALTASFLLR